MPKRETKVTRTGGAYKKPQPKSYLLSPEYQTATLPEYIELSCSDTFKVFARARWGAERQSRQICPKCGTEGAHYPVNQGAFKWKCRDKDCKTQFSVFPGTCLHGFKLDPTDLLGILFQFVEAKDSISAREISALYGLNHQTAHILLHKIREAIQVELENGPKLTGEIHADAAYFIKHRRPGNIGTGGAAALKAESKAAGQEEEMQGKVGKAKKATTKTPYYHPDMHVLIVFVQTGLEGERRYRVVRRKTETNQVDVRKIAYEFCEQGAVIVTDQGEGYNQLGARFNHTTVNHSVEFQNREGFDTNFAENFFSRMRHAQAGAWHRMSVQHLERYGWEFAWRLGNVGKDNAAQMRELLEILMRSKRSSEFADYWSKRPEDPDQSKTETETGFVHEISKNKLRRPTVRPAKNRVASNIPDPPKKVRKSKKPKKQVTRVQASVTWSEAAADDAVNPQPPARPHRGISRGKRGIAHEAPIPLQAPARFGYPPLEARVKLLLFIAQPVHHRNGLSQLRRG